MPYTLIPRLKRADLPETFSPVVEAVLEVDRLFWLDPKNAGQKEFSRKFIPGEELPYILAPGENSKGQPRTRVYVQRWGRRFIVDGKPMLEIEDNPPEDEKKKIKKVKKDYVAATKNTLQEFRKFMGEYTRQTQAERDRRSALLPSVEERLVQSERDKQLAQERRAIKAAARSATIAAKRNRHRNGRALADGDPTNAS
jgi:hypothetical protein